MKTLRPLAKTLPTLLCFLALVYPQQGGMGPGPGLGKPPGGGGGPSDFVTDTFTETSDTNITSHTGELGATWTVHPDAGYGSTATVHGATDRLFTVNVTTAFFASGTPPSADYSVCADVFAHSNIAINVAVAGRMDTTVNTMYVFRYNSGTSWDLRKIVTGTQTTLGTSSNQLITLGTSKRACLVMSGTSISGTVEGVTEVGPITDSAITAAGKAGVRFSGTATSSTGFHLDNFSAR